MSEQESMKESSTAVTAPTTPIISSTPGAYDEGDTLEAIARRAESSNINMENNDEGSKGGAKNTVGSTKDEGDFNVANIVEQLNLNNYASKKTLAQAILDLGLLAANASQLKYILSVGEEHEFYEIIFWLVITSIVLQVVQAIICIILGLVLNINQVDEQKAADIVNNICLCVVVLIVVVNVIISGFDIKGTEDRIGHRGKS